MVRDPDGDWVALSQRASLTGSLEHVTNPGPVLDYCGQLLCDNEQQELVDAAIETLLMPPAPFALALLILDVDPPNHGMTNSRQPAKFDCGE